ncbi:MAG: transcription termination/antitermination protein NusA [Candidatus Dormibacteria bacterium]
MARERHADPVTALHDLSEDMSISEDAITSAVEQAVVETYRKLVEDDAEVRAKVDVRSGSWEVFRVVDGVETPARVDKPEFPRLAAAAVRAAVAGRVEEESRRKVLDAGAARHGQLVDAIIERPAGPGWYVDAGGMPGLLPPEERIPGELLDRHQHIKVVVLEARTRTHDAVLVVSRSHPLLLHRLLEQEVPELQNGQVVIRGIARDPGRRSKVAVEAPAGEIDPQGACIGPKGVRQRAVTSELGAEQVQIVAWAADPQQYVKNSLIPATVERVELDDSTHTAHAAVPSTQLSLAIGRSGENARLAARLTGWRIDIAAAESPQE